MASSLKFLIVSTFIVCYAQAQLSKHTTKVIKKIRSDVEDEVSSSCYSSFKTILDSATSDSAANQMCTTVQERKTQIVARCKDAEYQDIKKIACKEVKKSKEEMADRLIRYSQVYTDLYKTCKSKLGNMARLTTWKSIEQLCDQISNTDEKDYKLQCPNDDYDDVKRVICGGASTILSGMVTLGLCLMTSLFNKF